MENNESKPNHLAHDLYKGFIRCLTFAVLFSGLNTMAVTLERWNESPAKAKASSLRFAPTIDKHAFFISVQL